MASFVDVLGKARTSKVRDYPDDRSVRFTYRSTSSLLPTYWSLLERKKIAGARARFERETTTAQSLYCAGLNVPHVLSADPCVPSMTVERIEGLQDFVDMVMDRRAAVHLDDKLGHILDGARQMRKMHELGIAWGDTYPKNFFVSKGHPRGDVYCCDFELERAPADLARDLDVVMFAAGMEHLLRQGHPGAEREVRGICRQVYGGLPSFPFDMRDKAFYAARFGARNEFFDAFSVKGA